MLKTNKDFWGEKVGNKKNEYLEQQKKKSREFTQMMQTACKNDLCLKILKFTFDRSGVDKPNISRDDSGNIDTKAMMYNEGRRSLYLELRPFLTRAARIEIEIGNER